MRPTHRRVKVYLLIVVSGLVGWIAASLLMGINIPAAIFIGVGVVIGTILSYVLQRE
jgi:hypothetical protein